MDAAAIPRGRAVPPRSAVPTRARLQGPVWIRPAAADATPRRSEAAVVCCARRTTGDGVTWRQVAATVLFSALATIALLTLAHMRTSQVAAEATAAVVAVVGEGESLQAFAARVDPEVPVDVTLARIAEMNALDGDEVGAGSRLLVPASGRE